MAAIGGRPIAPLLAVDGAEIAAFVGPFVPDGHLAILQPADVGVAAQEPEQFDDARAQMELLGVQHRETRGENDANLRAEYPQPADPGAAVPPPPRIQDLP